MLKLNRITLLMLLVILCAAPMAQGGIAYDNTLTRIAINHGLGLDEGGDQLTLNGACRVVTGLQLGFPAGAGSADIVVRIYANDGPITAVNLICGGVGDPRSVPTPGTLLFDSGTQTIPTIAGFNIFTVSVPNITVPDSITWTMQRVDGTALTLYRYDPPTVGSSGDYFLQRSGTTWIPKDCDFTSGGITDSFYGQVIVSDGGAPSITCPTDVTFECPALDTNPATTGTAVATGCGNIAVTFSDVETPACGGTSTITRTWTADDGSGGLITCDQLISTVDTLSPSITCPEDIAESGGFGGTTVSFIASAADSCDLNPTVSTIPASDSFFPTGTTSVSATAIDGCSQMQSCQFNVLVSCFGINRAKIGTKDTSCRGIESIEFTSMIGTEELISLFKAEEGSGGVEEDTLPSSIIVDDGVNGAVTVDTSCTQVIAIGDVFGPYIVSDIDKDYDDAPEPRGNKVELRGSFVPAVPYDFMTDDVTFSIIDAFGHSAFFTIPANSFALDGKPEKGKYKFEGIIGGAEVEAKFKGCKFSFKAKGATQTDSLTGTMMTVQLAINANIGKETIAMLNKGNHLKFKREPKVDCCPECIGIASLQVTSSKGVLVFNPAVGESTLPSNIVVNDGLNGSVTIHTSCSQAIDVGDVFGAYTISEVIKVFE